MKQIVIAILGFIVMMLASMWLVLIFLIKINNQDKSEDRICISRIRLLKILWDYGAFKEGIVPHPDRPDAIDKVKVKGIIINIGKSSYEFPTNSVTWESKEVYSARSSLTDDGLYTISVSIPNGTRDVLENKATTLERGMLGTVDIGINSEVTASARLEEHSENAWDKYQEESKIFPKLVRFCNK